MCRQSGTDWLIGCVYRRTISTLDSELVKKSCVTMQEVSGIDLNVYDHLIVKYLTKIVSREKRIQSLLPWILLRRVERTCELLTEMLRSLIHFPSMRI